MEFSAASAVPERYRQILADEELVGRLAFKLSIYSIDADDRKAVAAALRSFLTDLAHERKLEALWEMCGRAAGSERKAVQAALHMGLDECGESGHLNEPVGLLRKEDLAPKIRKAAEKALIEAMLVCGRGGRVSLVLELLDKEWLPEKVHVKALEVAGKGTYADYERYMETVIGLFEKEWASAGLKESAERALVEWAIDECLDRADPEDTGALLGLDENGMTATRDVDKGKLVSLVLGLVANGQIAAGVRVKAVEAAAACQHVDRGMLVDALEGVIEGGAPPELMGAVDRALKACGAQKFAEECAGKGPAELMGMREAARTGEKRFVDEAILGRFGEWACCGCAEELAAMLERKDLTPRLREAGEGAILEAVDARVREGKAGGLLGLLRMGWLPEKAHVKIMESAGKGQNVDPGRLVDALADVLGKKTGPLLREAAEKALPGAVEACIENKGVALVNLGAAAALFRRSGIPWEVLNRVMEGCSKTGQWTKIAHVFRREGMPPESARIAERALLESIDFFAAAKAPAPGADLEEERGMGQVVLILGENNLPESAYLRAIEACRRYGKVHYNFVEALGRMFPRADVAREVKGAAEEALMGGVLLGCAAAGYQEELAKMQGMVGVPERVKKEIGEILEVCHKLRAKQREEARNGSTPRTPVSLSGDQGFVDSKVRPPSSEKKAMAPAESAPVTRIVPANGRKSEN